jgi:hypothetical protein
MTPEVAAAVDEIKAAFAPSDVTVDPDGDGGAFVVIESVPLADLYVPDDTWLGFQITFQYPLSDVYPHFARGDLARVDGGLLGEATSPTTWRNRPAIQLSRRSNRLNPATDTAVLKALKVMTWLNAR